MIVMMGCCHSCQTSNESYAYQSVLNGVWERDSVVKLVFDSMDVHPTHTYSIQLELVHNKAYKYRNIWLLIGNNIANDSVLHYDTLKTMLMDEHGKWYGASVGGLHQLSVPFQQAVKFPYGKQCFFTVKQLMDDERLKGIEKIGIKITDKN